ncbi:MAG: hypothetical protein AAB426_01135 [Myxococcota bacterium]
MTTDADKESKQQRREAQRLWDDARLAYAAGDYAATRRLDAEIVALGAGHEMASRAAREIEGFKLDAWVLRAGLAAMAVYILAWVIALS